MKNIKGFTLIELLIVIAIIAIISAILFPVFATAREKARQTACISNEKQLGLALIQYSQDYDERYPGSGYYGAGWAERIYPYVQSIGVFQCPDDARSLPSKTPASEGSLAIPAAAAPLSYTLNENVADYPPPGPAITPGMPISQFTTPVLTVLLFESSLNGYGGPNMAVLNPVDANAGTDWGNTKRCSGDGFGDDVGYDSVPSSGYGSATIPGCTSSNANGILAVTRHDSVTYLTNFVMADGHVKTLGLTKVADPCNGTQVLIPNLGKGNGFVVTFAYQ